MTAIMRSMRWAADTCEPTAMFAASVVPRASTQHPW